MKRTTKLAIAIGLALGFGIGATALNAHPYGNGPGWGMGGGPGWGHGHMMGYGSGPGYGMGPWHGAEFGPGGVDGSGDYVEKRLAWVKAELGITPAQEGVWNAYAEQAKLQHDAMRKLMITMHESGAASLPERIELREQIWKQRQAQTETMAQKVKDLYAALTPEQRPLADRFLGGFGPRAGGRWGYRNR